ncbi:hypothetical protein H257_04099 [Aphanomyces astaci]|uniref:Uncharacterized protein n=1 Tax=Aphanomyces astaci TaxID=112090 RepID=W4GWQ3_APHAT|nr:hypothetical protein H257_04099 [Aphanomyces astaci]ETV83348.1 hypothetical protein H257_04099 [Aphanomyces astaci]|eukprot:XP_009826778.1 hypothetical protein H257_04099 [Aphanomyces astaci]
MTSCVVGLDNFTGSKSRVKEPKDYHGGPKDTPTSRRCKKRLQEECVRYGIEFSEGDFKGILWQKLSQHIQQHVNSVVVDPAKARGHTVVYTPHYHSDLYTSYTKFTQVKTRIDAAFAALTPTAIKGCVKVAAQGKLQSLYEYLLQVDAMNCDEESPAARDNEDGDEEGGDSSNE